MQSNWAGPLAYVVSPEDGGYIGIPVLILTGFLVWQSRHSSRMQLSAALFITSALVSLGPFLTIHSRATHVPLPFWLLGHLPFIDNVLPVRISFGMDACLAAMIAFGLDDMRAARVRVHQRGSLRQPGVQERGAIIVTGVALVVLIVTQLPQWPYVKPPAPVLPTSIRQVIPVGDPVAITYPYADGSLILQPLLWQADDGYGFRLTGGYSGGSFHPDSTSGGAVGTESDEPSWPAEVPPRPGELLSPRESYRIPGGCGTIPLTPDLVATARTTLSKYDVGLVIIDRGYPEAVDVLDLFRRALGAPTVSAGAFTLWIIPQSPPFSAAPPPSPVVQPPPPTQPPATPVYVVQSGDTLWALAARYLGNPLRYQQLFALNRGISQVDGYTLVDPNLIYPGMKLLFPADATGLPPPAP